MRNLTNRARLRLESLESREVMSATLAGGALNNGAAHKAEAALVRELNAAGRVVPHKESTEGQVISQVDPTEDTPGTLTWTASGKATHMGNYTEAGSHRFTAPDERGIGLVLDGVFTSTAADGSTISGTYSGTYEILGDGTARFDVTAVWVSGTGRFAGVTGQGPVVANMDLATGAFHFDTDATWTYS